MNNNNSIIIRDFVLFLYLFSINKKIKKKKKTKKLFNFEK